MNVLKGENNVFCDVDGTLIYHVRQTSQLNVGETILNVQDPLDASKNIKVGVNRNMVRLLKEEYQRGSRVIVWSRGGWQWAQNVVKALDLGKRLERDIIIMSKPLVYFDDLPVEQWLQHRVFIEPATPYKR